MIVILSGVSGVGKTTIAQLLEDNHNFAKAISYTTRKKRENEENHKDYIFIERSEFEEKIFQEFFLEYVHQFDNFYGSSFLQIEKLLDTDKKIVMCLTHDGFLAAKKRWPNKVLGIYLLPPTIEELHARVHDRASKEHTCDKRLDAMCEIEHHELYEHKIEPSTIQETLNKVLKLIEDHIQNNK